MSDFYMTAEGSTVMLTGLLPQGQAEEIAVNRSVLNPGRGYEVHGCNGHAGWLVAVVRDGQLARPCRACGGGYTQPGTPERFTARYLPHADFCPHVQGDHSRCERRMARVPDRIATVDAANRGDRK